MHRLGILLCMFALSIMGRAQTYNSERLSQIARMISLSVLKTDSVDSCGYMDCGTFKNMPITIGLDNNGIVNHIGYKLFDINFKRDYPSVVYDFAERYLLELDCIQSDLLQRERLQDDKVNILEGSLANVKKITPQTMFNITHTNDFSFEVSWTEGDRTLLSMQFPTDYELILGMPKVEIEKKFKDIVLGTKPSERHTIEYEYEVLQDSIYQSAPLANYHLKNLNTATYFIRQNSTSYLPIYSNEHKWYSAANLFQDLIVGKAYRLYIEQNVYGFNTITYSIPLESWLNYCRANSMTIYFAIEEEHEDGLKALLIAQSHDLGFNHMMSIIIPDNFVDKPNATLKATLNAFIPTQNVKELYQKITKKSKKKI